MFATIARSISNVRPVRPVRSIRMVAPLVLVTALAAAMAPQPGATAEASGPGFPLIAEHSGKCLEPTPSYWFFGWFVPGGNVVQQSCDEGADQKWNFRVAEYTYNPITELYDAEYMVTNVSTGKCMDVKSWSREDRAQVQEYDCHGGANQRWRTKSMGYGTYGERLMLINVNSSKCLDIYGWSRIDGAHAQQYACHGGSNQIFQRPLFGTP